VATTVVGLDGKGRAAQFADYAQWEAWMAENTAAEDAARAAESEATRSDQKPAAAPQKKKLSYLEAREFASIEQRVEESDAKLAAARAKIESPEIATDAAALQEALTALAEAERENEALYARWAELSEKAG
jgi:ATP-binding cassette subfamily F protein uup